VEAVERWCVAIDPVVRLFRRYRRRMVMADALLMLRGTEAELAQLGSALSLNMAAVQAPALAPDLTRAVAELVARDVLVAGTAAGDLWEEVLAASHLLEARGAGFDAVEDLAAACLAANQADAGTPADVAEPQPAEPASDTEADLLRAAMLDMSGALAAADKRGNDAFHRLEAASARAATLTEEVRLLRAQLITLNDAWINTDEADRRSAADLRTETGLLRAQLRVLSDLLEDNRKHRQAAANSFGLPPIDAARAVALLHEQLTEMQGLLENTVRRGATMPNVHPRVEAAMASLLAENIAELERSLRLENDLMAAQKSLRVLQADRTAAMYRLT
jgi:hypothetical protein